MRRRLLRRRLLGWCLLAFPRDRRRRDGAVLRDLALDLAGSRGVVREAASLVRGGVACRLRSWSLRRRVAVLALCAAPVAVWAGPAAGGVPRAEVEHFACAGPGCGEAERAVADRREDGWRCAPARPAADDEAAWRCSR